MRKLQGITLVVLLAIGAPAHAAELKIFGSRVTKVSLGRSSKRRRVSSRPLPPMSRK
jgi:hypothetical protein